MAIKPVIQDLNEVAEGLRGEYKEFRSATGEVSFVLDFDGVLDGHPATRSLRDEAGRYRIAAKAAKEELSALSGYAALGPLAELQQRLDRAAELEAAGGAPDEAKLTQAVEARLRSKLAPVERERDQLKTQYTEAQALIEGLQKERALMTLHSAVRAELDKAQGFATSAAEDALVFAERMLEVDDSGRVVTRDNVGVTPGVSVAVWLQEMQPRKPHWWGPTQGAGATGARGGSGGRVNPFTAENWSLTAQGDLLKTDRRLAEQFAASAGTKIGGPKPAAKR